MGFRISHSFQFPLIPFNYISLSFHNPHLPNTHTQRYIDVEKDKDNTERERERERERDRYGRNFEFSRGSDDWWGIEGSTGLDSCDDDVSWVQVFSDGRGIDFVLPEEEVGGL